METLFPLPKPIPKNLLNPMLAFGISSPGQRCKDCRHLEKYAQSKVWYKCNLRHSKHNGPSSDHGKYWQACSKFHPDSYRDDPSCTSCGAKQLADCFCPLKK